MSTDDLMYLALLIGCIPFGHVLKLSSNFGTKKLLSCTTGILITCLLCGYKDILHSFITIFGNYIIVKALGIQHCRWVSFIFTFLYLFFFRICQHLGFPLPAKHTNAVQLLVTLRMVSLSFELYDISNKTKKDDDDDDEEGNGRIQDENIVSLYDHLSYGYCYIGLMTGPFYTFKTFQDMLRQDASNISTIRPAIKNLKLLPFIAVPYIFLNKYFPTDYLASDEYLNHPWGIAYQLLILLPTFTHFRWRFYIGWLLAESMCITAALGAYPKSSEAKPGIGPTKVIDETKISDEEEYDFETIHNINIMGVELAPTMQVAMKEWNMTIQWWMATYVYKKLPIQSKQVRMFVLLFVSAFWHGVAPGYYVTFLSVPMVVIAEQRMVKAIKPYLDTRLVYWMDCITWFCLFRSFEYLGVGFMLLRLDIIWKVWTRMFFVGHIFIFLFILLPIILPRKRRDEESDGNTKSELKKD